MNRALKKIIDKINKYDESGHISLLTTKNSIVKFANKKQISTKQIIDEVAKRSEYQLTKISILLGLCTDNQLYKDWILYNDILYHNTISSRDLENGANPTRIFDGKNAFYIATENMRIDWIECMLKNTKYTIDATTMQKLLNKAATVAKDNQKLDILMCYLKNADINFKIERFYSTHNGAEFISVTSVEIIRLIFNNPEMFLNLTDSEILGKNLKYYKQAAFYGLQRQAKTLKSNNCLYDIDIEKSKILVEKINKKIDLTFKEQKKKELQKKKEQELQKQKELETKAAKQELENRYNKLIDTISPLNDNDTVEKIEQQAGGQNTVETAIKSVKTNGKDYSYIEK